MNSNEQPATPNRRSVQPDGSTAARAKCQNCHHWERYFEAPRDGYCPVFNKSTDRYHGSKCTAYQERYYE